VVAGDFGRGRVAGELLRGWVVNLGSLFFVIAMLFFFLAGIGVLIPNGVAWGLFSLCLGLLLSGVPLTWPRG
jgi:hypothetical protein